ncbi:MAG: hypothetical protein RR738_01850 [Anaerorhabdus sp.]
MPNTSKIMPPKNEIAQNLLAQPMSMFGFNILIITAQTINNKLIKDAINPKAIEILIGLIENSVNPFNHNRNNDLNV